jgi:hypothetical protein
MKKPAPKPVQVPVPGKLKDFGGSFSDGFNNVLANQVVNTIWLDSDREARDQQFQAALVPLIGIKPANEIEGMLAAQMVATHNAAMECFRRAMLREQTFEARRENLTQANKLTRSYAMLLEALNRNRGKGQQKVTVEHVHVHSGGQAIVGAVQGGGVARESENRPHASNAITHEPAIPMRSADPEREAVPVAAGAWEAPL